MASANDTEIQRAIDGLWTQLEETMNTPDAWERHFLEAGTNKYGITSRTKQEVSKGSGPITSVLRKETFRRVKDEMYEGSLEFLHHPQRWFKRLMHSYADHAKAVLRDAKDGKIPLNEFGRDMMATYDVDADVQRIDSNVLRQIDMLTEGSTAYRRAFEEGDFDRAKRINEGLRAAKGDRLTRETIEFYNDAVDLAIATGDVGKYLEAVRLMKNPDDPTIKPYRPSFEETLGRMVAAAYKPTLMVGSERSLTQTEQRDVQDIFYRGLVSRLTDSLLGDAYVPTPEEFEGVVKTLASEQASSISRLHPVRLEIKISYAK